MKGDEIHDGGEDQEQTRNDGGDRCETIDGRTNVTNGTNGNVILVLPIIGGSPISERILHGHYQEPQAHSVHARFIRPAQAVPVGIRCIVPYAGQQPEGQEIERTCVAQVRRIEGKFELRGWRRDDLAELVVVFVGGGTAGGNLSKQIVLRIHFG
jgi:hypothetical protein